MIGMSTIVPDQCDNRSTQAVHWKTAHCSFYCQSAPDPADPDLVQAAPWAPVHALIRQPSFPKSPISVRKRAIDVGDMLSCAAVPANPSACSGANARL
jgi:hypothetical protein